RFAEEHCQRPAQRDEHFLLVRIEMAAAARVRRVAPHACARLLEPRRVGDRRLAARGLAVQRLTLFPLQLGAAHDVVAHAATIPSRAMARPTYPRAGEPRPAALPPRDRTVGQLVAESVRFYGENFVRCLVLGVPPALLAVVTANVSKTLELVLAPTVYGALLSASLIGACVMLLGVRPPTRRLAAAGVVGWIVFAPVPFLVVAFVLPALMWLAAVGLVVPVIVAEDLSVRGSFRRAWPLARADYVHALGSLATLAIVVGLTQVMLVFILRGAGGTAIDVAVVLANIVISPLLFIGTALLYVDQAARVQ